MSGAPEEPEESGVAPDEEPVAGGDATDDTAAEADSGEPVLPSDDPSDDEVVDGELDSEIRRIEAALEHDIFEVLAERDQFKDIAQRLQADFDNYRRRSAAQAADEIDRATGRLAEAFLPVLDAAEAAYLRHPDEVGPLLNVMLTELKKHGLETLDLDGQPFDPEVAEAVAHESGNTGEVLVAEVLRSGYRWRNKTLRPAMVRTRD